MSASRSRQLALVTRPPRLRKCARTGRHGLVIRRIGGRDNEHRYEKRPEEGYGPPRPRCPSWQAHSGAGREFLGSQSSAQNQAPSEWSGGALVEDRGEAALERAREDLAHGALLEALDQLGHEALDDQALRLGLGQPARAEVEELLLVDLCDRRRVRAADVVGEDLEARDRVRVGSLRQQQVAALLERVGLLGARVDLDHPAPDGGRAVAQDAAEGEVGDRVRRGVLLRGVEVDVLALVRRVGTRDLGLGALAGELRLHPHAATCGAEADGDPVELAVALHLGALGAEDPRLLVQVLAADVAELGVLADDKLDSNTGLPARTWFSSVLLIMF